MKSKVAALMMAMAVVLLAVTASLAGKVLFEDKFTSLDPSWGAPGPIMDVKDGKLIITPQKNTSQTILNQANVFPNDAEISLHHDLCQGSGPHLGQRPGLLGQRLQRILLPSWLTPRAGLRSNVI